MCSGLAAPAQRWHVPHAVLVGQLVERGFAHTCARGCHVKHVFACGVWGQDWFGSDTSALCAHPSRQWMRSPGCGGPQDSEGPRNIPPPTEARGLAEEDGLGILPTLGKGPLDAGTAEAGLCWSRGQVLPPCSPACHPDSAFSPSLQVQAAQPGGGRVFQRPGAS